MTKVQRTATIGKDARVRYRVGRCWSGELAHKMAEFDRHTSSAACGMSVLHSPTRALAE